MPLVFKSASDSTDRTEIVGAGVLFPNGKGGIPVARAAETMSELQEKNPDGTLRYDDEGNPIPLSGSKLSAAAKAFAEDRGFEVVNLKEEQIDGLPQEAGMTPDRPPMDECAREDYARSVGELTPVNADPERLVNPQPGDGVPVIPDTDPNEKGD